MEDAGDSVLGRRLSGSECTQEIAASSAALVVPYALLILYSFLGLAIICDEYFEPVLSAISGKLGLSDDVAGATFMAAGSSAPELFTSMSDAFFSQNNIGIGTIVGSAMFNILVIVAMSAYVTTGAVKIDWRPVLRDVAFYLGAIGLMGFSMMNHEVCVDSLTNNILSNSSDILDSVALNGTLQGVCADKQYEVWSNDTIVCATCGLGEVVAWEGGLMVFAYMMYILFMVFNESILGKCKSIKVAADGADQDKKPADEENKDEEEDNGPWYIPPKGILNILYWIISFPIVAVLKWMPNCEEGFFKGWLSLSFSACIVVIGGFCLLMVHYASLIGCILNIDPVVMGVVVLAAGTSIPDMISSMIVARQGQADMAIANAVGSNVFDILLGLGLPWMLVALTLNHTTLINLDGVVTEVIILVCTVFVYLFTLAISKWKMTRSMGLVFTILYFCYIAYALIRESSKEK